MNIDLNNRDFLVSKELKSSFFLENIEATDEDYKIFKQTEDFIKLRNEKRIEVTKEMFEFKENKEILNLLNKIEFFSLKEVISNMKDSIIRELPQKYFWFYHDGEIKGIDGNNFYRFMEILKNNGVLNFLCYRKVSNKKGKNISDYIFYKDKYLSITESNLHFFIKDFQNYGTILESTFLTKDLEFKKVKRYLNELILKKFSEKQIKRAISKEFDYKDICELLSKNSKLTIFSELYRSQDELSKNIPEDLTSLFPLARTLNRHFILHIGDTNTGKTYEALEELKIANEGVYLAPLRLLALEVQEKLNNCGVPCSMTTGEEEDIIEGAKHMSCTVEKLDIDKKYDICVIDEAQMIDDNDRGWAWTNAILGVYADKIHICLAESAKEIVIKLIELCNDTYEIKEHKRNTKLIFEKESFKYPNDIKDHDALIVFSRKNVLAVASDLESKGIKTSVVYGALPYSVRKNEVRKFLEGETKVVVSTDAIGMGMNLPIKRIVFLESIKFDGKQKRFLNTSEVKQIAGRAGRRGLFNEGYVNSSSDKTYLEETLFEEYKSIETARIQMPKSLINLDFLLSTIMKNWMAYPDNNIFKKSILKEDLVLCNILESNNKLLNLSKEAMLDLINIPFDKNNEEFVELWFNLIKDFYTKGDISNTIYIQNIDKSLSLDDLEKIYKKLDLLYSFCRTTGYNKDDFLKNITSLKEETSIQLIEKLKTKEAHKKCITCGKKLKWDSKYSICDKCHNKNYYNYWR